MEMDDQLDVGHPRIIKLVKFFGKPAAEVVGTVQRVLPVYNIEDELPEQQVGFFERIWLYSKMILGRAHPAPYPLPQQKRDPQRP